MYQKNKIIILFFTPHNKILTQDTFDPLKKNPAPGPLLTVFESNQLLHAIDKERVNL